VPKDQAVLKSVKVSYDVWVAGSMKERRRGWGYKFPPLVDCRKQFAEEIQQEIPWGQEWEGEVWQHEDERVEDDGLPY
jgi:hypothetical protein